MTATIVYTDGACLGNPGPGGWAWAMSPTCHRSGSAAWTTNQRMEVTAVLEALKSVKSALVVVSDSTYVVNCFRDRWWVGWEARGWRNANRRPVANQDLWRPLVEVVKGRPGLQFRWVKGHSGDPLNELADRLANEAAAAAVGLGRAGRPGQGAHP